MRGLTASEASASIALQRRELVRSGRSAVADVSRLQVYNTAEALEGRGLVDIQQSNPITYRPVGIEKRSFALSSNTGTAFEHIESGRMEEREDVWTGTGRETMDLRITYLNRRGQDEGPVRNPSSGTAARGND